MVRWCVETDNGQQTTDNGKHKWCDGAMVRCFSIFTCARQRKDGERLDEFDD